MAPQQVVFTDLDGTLLDPVDHSWRAARPAVERLRRRSVPVVFCSAKTRAEQEAYRRELRVMDPFIVENGGAIFIPRGYFGFEFDYDRSVDDYQVIELGRPYAEIRGILARVRAELGLDFEGFADLTAAQVAELTGLDLPSAERAKAREYDETLILNDLSPDERAQVLEAIEGSGLRWTHGGLYYHAMGANDKGRAVLRLTVLLRRRFGRVETIGIGDSRNDEALLAVVDIPALIQKRDGGWEPLERADVLRVVGVGPVGWRRAIEELVPS